MLELLLRVRTFFSAALASSCQPGRAVYDVRFLEGLVITYRQQGSGCVVDSRPEVSQPIV